MSNSTPSWATNYDPPAAEWNLWWAKKQDWSTVLDQLVAQGGAITPNGPNTVNGPLTLSYTGGPALTVNSSASINSLTVTSMTVSGIGTSFVATNSISVGQTAAINAVAAQSATVTGAGTALAVTNSASVGGSLAVTGLIVPNSAVGIFGTTAGDNAQAGSVGRFVSVTVTSGAAVTLTSNTAVPITTTSLPAGDYDVWGTVVFVPAGSTTVSSLAVGINIANNAALPVAPAGGYAQIVASLSTGSQQALPVNQSRVNVTTATSIYLMADSAFGTSTMTAYGILEARVRR